MTINRTQIMTTAWAKTASMMNTLGCAKSQLRDVFRIELTRAWHAEKAAALQVIRSATSIWAEIQILEDSTRLGFMGMQKLRMLRQAHREAVIREADGFKVAA